MSGRCESDAMPNVNRSKKLSRTSCDVFNCERARTSSRVTFRFLIHYFSPLSAIHLPFIAFAPSTSSPIRHPKESKEEIKRLLAEEKLETEWNSYMRCNGLPNANDPSDLRKYIHMWIDDFKKLNQKEINWLLKTNEQSILTQDQTVVDLSRANLKKIQPEVGDMYAKRASEVLGILDEMDAVIRDRYALSANKMDDLLNVSRMQFN